MTNSEVVQQQIWNVQLVGQIGTSGTTDDVVLSGNYAYVTEREGYLRIIDVSNPAASTETGFYDTPGWATDVAVASSLWLTAV